MFVLGVESLENTILILWLDADAFINREDSLVAGPRSRDVDTWRFVSAIFDGILQ